MREHETEIRLLLDAIYHRYQYDFRDYAMTSIGRRVEVACARFGLPSIDRLRERVLEDRDAFPQLLEHVTVQVSDLFRDPEYYRSLRDDVVPVLATYPSLRLWVAGCSTGEEAYSLAILLAEEGLLERSLIYATDINQESLRRAKTGIYALDRFQRFTENHRLSGGKSSLSDYYRAAYGSAVFDGSLRKRIVFSDHSLTTDSVFAEMQLISCRNVLIYFSERLQNRVLGLLSDSLCRRGFLGLGSKESLRAGNRASEFDEVSREARVYRRRG